MKSDYDRLGECLNFIESIECQTDNWDKICDCGIGHGSGIHSDGCMTIKARQDVKSLFKE